MKDEKSFREFIALFQFPEGKANELIEYIVTIMGNAEREGKDLSFDYLAKISNSPNPCMSHDGKLYVTTSIMRKAFDDYLENVRYVKTEAALMAMERYKILHDVASRPLKGPEG